MVNSFGPLLPLRALKPSNGILDVPVTNYTKTTPLLWLPVRWLTIPEGDVVVVHY